MRGSYSTPDVPGESVLPVVGNDSQFTFEWCLYGDRKTQTINPASFETPVIAGELAATWVQVLSEFGRYEASLTSGLLSLLRSMAALPLTRDQKGRFALRDLRRAHLDLWELTMLARHRSAKSDIAYRMVVHVFALLRRHEDDHPGTLHEEVVDRLVRQPRLWHHRNEGLPALSPDEIRAWRRWAYQKAKSALLQPDRGIGDIDVQTATHVLLSLATGEPPEVLRALTVHDIEATATPAAENRLPDFSPSARIGYLASNDLIELLRVRYTKNRAHTIYDEVYTRRDTAPFTAFRWALMLNAAARADSGNSSLILMQDNNGVVKQPPWRRPTYLLSAIALRNSLPLSGPNQWARLRKVVTTREVLADPRAYLSDTRRHSAKTFFGHYTNSPVLRAEAGRILIDAVNDMFDSATSGPTVITPEAEQAIRSGAPAPGIDAVTAGELVTGQLDGPHAGCRDPLASPYENKGTVCTKSITGTCFACPNALITLHHLPAALAIQEMANPDRAADPEIWLTHWKPIYDTITETILPAFTPEQIQTARLQANLIPIDVGVLNDMRGASQNPPS